MTLSQAPTPKTPVKQCICCGRKLSSAIKHAETALGPVGPECKQKYDIEAATERLYAYDLGELLDGGEIRLDGVRTSAGSFTFPNAAFEELKAKAKACGVALSWKPDLAARQFVVTLRADSISDLLEKVDMDNMLTLTNPVTGAVQVPVLVGVGA